MSFPVYLRNGEQVKENDHVYCSPSWDSRDGTPYSVARIMQFLPPEDAPKGEPGKNYLYTRVRLAWYYRPSDVSDRPVADSRLLLAAIYSEVCDINQLRAKCHVVHRDKISDLAGWKKRPDRFYFNRLFDPYIKKEFEIIQSQDVRNLPKHIRDNLIERYEYVVAEKEVIPDLTDNIRNCKSCEEWCPSSDSVQCDRCKNFFHMKCVQPPLAAKPARGYGWTCAPCSRKHEEEVDSHEIRHTTPVSSTTKLKSNAPAARGRGRPRKDKTQAEKEENMTIKHFNMWPFRYFGQHTVAEDTLDEEDLIFPRTASRVGPKYQATVPPTPEPYNLPPDIEERGGDDTVEVLGIVNSFTESEMREADETIKRLSTDRKTSSSVDWLTEVVKRISELAMEGAITSLTKIPSVRLEKWKKHETPYTDKPWSRDEEVAFEDAIQHHGAELRAVHDEVPSRTMPEIVRFYGQWKCQKLGEENHRPKSKAETKAAQKQWKTLSDLSGGQRLSGSDDDSSIIAQPSKTPNCAACRTRESQTWWKAPKGLATGILCDACGLNWRKYADLNVRPVREESLPSSKARDKREGTPLAGPSTKRPRTSTSVQSATPPAVAHASHNRCLSCHKTGPPGKVVKCKQCGFKVHVGTVGAIVDAGNAESWICELCENEETQEASMNTDCLLCPRASNEDKKSGVWPPADSFLRACKPTEGQGWVHVLCAVFVSELSFTDPSRLRLVEGVSTITRHKWTSKCWLCGESEGAVIRCSDCAREFHASCAWKQGHKFGFEIQPVKSSRRETTTIATFKGESGSMSAIVSCKDHDHSKRTIYDICETNEGGETALQTYCQHYKQAQPSQAHGLLRKARRLDTILNIRRDTTPESTPDTVEPECYKCHTQFSPVFYPALNTPVTNGINGRASGSSSSSNKSTSGKDKWMCHRCHFEANETNGKAMGMMVS